jgi:hypothetical protein
LCPALPRPTIARDIRWSLNRRQAEISQIVCHRLNRDTNKLLNPEHLLSGNGQAAV